MNTSADNSVQWLFLDLNAFFASCEQQENPAKVAVFELPPKEASMEQATTIGLDIAKHVFHVHGADAAGHVLFRKRITRAKLLGFLAAQARCVVAMEACAGAHYWARGSLSWAIMCA
jgi:hypothetical protein